MVISTFMKDKSLEDCMEFRKYFLSRSGYPEGHSV